MGIENVKAMTFDVFGTVVDWRASITREGRKLGGAKGITGVDWVEFADAWRGGYRPSMDLVRTGKLPWTKIDDLHRMVLDELLAKYNITGLTEEEKVDFNKAWHRLDPWPDSVAGLNRLKSRYIISTLSNGNVALLTNMAKWGGLPWDCVLSAESVRHYKPDPESYLGAADLLGVEPSELMMVAAHKYDLMAAHDVGLKTGFVGRPDEHGPDREVDVEPEDWMDAHGTDFEDFAAKLGL
ncbi:MAG: haloacid dehalogenase type II [SAR202 cluster bacterium]|jgi:2-haloacid dehalogenase|nr:haloacid dehalogenase type II [SAR202 cluster bacterium]MDP6300014.1 haloacid dehalogenase type II [SAR202 cluster bacterium]MDP7413151.1 haloacid dehalogenase type II [SAR202 cluster bacterium]